MRADLSGTVDNSGLACLDSGGALLGWAEDLPRNSLHAWYFLGGARRVQATPGRTRSHPAKSRNQDTAEPVSIPGQQRELNSF